MDRELVQLGVPAAEAASAPRAVRTAPAAGAQERDASPWLGRDIGPSRTFRAYQRSL